MKHRWNKALALMLALALTIAAVAIAEEAAMAGGAAGESAEIVEIESTIETPKIESEVEDAGEIALDDLADMPAEDTPIAEEPAGGDTAEDADWNGAETWRFLVGDAVVATQEAREGDEIQLPDDPAAPEGMAFDGWYFEDGTPLLADADGDGAIDAVIAHPDPLVSEVNVLARFVEAEEPAAEEPTEEPAGEEPAEEEPAEEEPTEEELTEEEPAEEEPTEEEPAAEEEPTEEEPTEEEPAVEEPAEEPAAEEPTEEPAVEEPAAEEPAQEPSIEEEASEPAQQPSVEEEAPEAAPALPTANALTYTGEAQVLVTGEGWLYSLDGEAYSAELPAAVNAGEYTVYFIPADAIDAQPQALTVTVAKADVVFTPPVAAATGE